MQRPEIALTPTGTYPVQMNDKQELFIKCRDSHLVLDVLILVNTLREIGFVITYPAPKLVKDIQEFLQNIELLKHLTNNLGDIITISILLENRRTYLVTLAPTSTLVNLRITSGENSAIRFEGYIESLDEFRLIWNRIL
jgi:hypothetical protein